MDHQGRLWIEGDNSATAIDATVTIDGHQLSIASGTESLGSWPLSGIEVARQGLDFALTIEDEHVVFRLPAADARALERDLEATGGIGRKIRSAASTPSPLSADEASSPTRAGRRTRKPPSPRTDAITIGAAGAVLVLASFMPWAQALVFSVSGTSGDGVITAVVGVLVVVLALVGRDEPSLAVRITTVLGFGFAAYITWTDFSAVGVDLVGAGLVLAMIVSVIGVVFGIVWIARKYPSPHL
jgi:hypothetical protein